MGKATEEEWQVLFAAWQRAVNAGRFIRIRSQSRSIEREVERAGWTIVRVGPFAEVLAHDGERMMLCLDRGDVIAVDVTHYFDPETTFRPDG
jgi:hypothetical protein